MNFINDIPEGLHRERLRAEVRELVDARSRAEAEALTRLNNFQGALYSGSTAASLAFLAAAGAKNIPVAAVLSVGAFSAALLAYSISLYLQFQLSSSRYNLLSQTAQRFFTRESSLEDFMDAIGLMQTKWLYRIMFWMPLALLLLGVALETAAATSFGPTFSKAR